MTRRKRMTKADLIYIAGFFDGEGSITIHHNFQPSPRGKSPNHTLQVSIGNTDRTVLDSIHAAFGGSFSVRPGQKKNHREVFQWGARCRGALKFLKAIRPYLRMKCAQADVAIAYQERKTMQGPQRLSPAVIMWREEQRHLIRQLNGRNLNKRVIRWDINTNKWSAATGNHF